VKLALMIAYYRAIVLEPVPYVLSLKRKVIAIALSPSMVQTVPKFDVISSLTVLVATIIMNAVGVAMGAAHPVCPSVLATPKIFILSAVPNANLVTIVSMALVIVETARVSQDTD
jgi:hypothetical protein